MQNFSVVVTESKRFLYISYVPIAYQKLSIVTIFRGPDLLLAVNQNPSSDSEELNSKMETLWKGKN